MFVLNKGKVKVLKIGRVGHIFPSGVSEQPETDDVINYVGRHKDLSFTTKPQKHTSPKKTPKVKSVKGENSKPSVPEPKTEGNSKKLESETKPRRKTRRRKPKPSRQED